jgi:zinc transport system substrate-binding protein
LADRLRVVTDILPIQGLVAAVLGETGDLSAIVPAGSSPHDFSLKPSVAHQIADADVIFWIGPDFSPWLKDVLRELGPNAQTHQLLNLETPPETDKDHNHDTDPHRWLDPSVAQDWLSAIANTLAKANPKDAPLYRVNAAKLAASIAQKTTKIAQQLAAVSDKHYMVYHDGYSGFESYFGLSHVAAVTDGHAATPGAAKLRELLEISAQTSPVCLFIDTPDPQPLAREIAAAGHMKIATLDMLGTDIVPDADFYLALLQRISDTMVACLKN